MTRDEQISKITSIIQEWGSTTSTDLELVKSPCIKSLGNNHFTMTKSIESFYEDGVEVVTYQDGIEKDFEFLEYDELSDKVLDEVFEIIDAYDVDMSKTMKRAED